MDRRNGVFDDREVPPPTDDDVPFWERDPLNEQPKKPKPTPFILAPTVAEILRSPGFLTKRRTIPTGIPHLDEEIAGGFKSKQSSVIAAPTGVGKTGLVGTIVHGLAQNKTPVLWVCTELAVEEQAARFTAIAMRKESGSNWTADDLLGHELPPEQLPPVMDGLPIHVRRVRRRDGDAFEVMTAQARAIADKYGTPPIIAVDYLQKLAVTDADQRRMSVSEVSDRLIELAEDINTHTIAISSVARVHYNATARKIRKQATEEDPRDWLACGKESGDIEYDGSLVTFLDVGDEADVTGNYPARLIVAKSRQGGIGFYGLRFHGPSGLFVPDVAAADKLKASAPEERAADLEKLKVEIRKLLMRRKVPFTSRSQIADRLEARKADVLAAIDEMFESDELTQDGRGKPIVFTPPAPSDSSE